MFNDVKFDKDINLNRNDVPYDMVCGGSIIEVIDNKKIYYEGKYKIVEYTCDLLIIKRKKGRIIINGSDISISNVSKTSFLLVGNIESIVFE